MRGAKGAIWQDGFYDRIIRDDVQLQATAEYIERNPVEAGFAALPADFRFSSAHPLAKNDREEFFNGFG